jgi:hypothetical protein
VYTIQEEEEEEKKIAVAQCVQRMRRNECNFEGTQCQFQSLHACILSCMPAWLQQGIDDSIGLISVKGGSALAQGMAAPMHPLHCQPAALPSTCSYAHASFSVTATDGTRHDGKEMRRACERPHASTVCLHMHVLLLRLLHNANIFSSAVTNGEKESVLACPCFHCACVYMQLLSRLLHRS